MRQKKQARNNVSVWNLKVVPQWHTSSSMATLPRPTQIALPMGTKYSHSNHHNLFMKKFSATAARKEEGRFYSPTNVGAETHVGTGITGSRGLLTVMWLPTLPVLICEISQLNQPISRLPHTTVGLFLHQLQVEFCLSGNWTQSSLHPHPPFILLLSHPST